MSFAYHQEQTYQDVNPHQPGSGRSGGADTGPRTPPLPHHDQGDVVSILAFTGLRWSELVGLRVGDIDLLARRLYVRQAAPEVEGRIIVGPPKTRSAVRTVPLP